MYQEYSIRVLIGCMVLIVVGLALYANLTSSNCLHAEFNQVVPVTDRAPLLSFKEFQAQRDKLQNARMFKTRNTFPRQAYEGSLLAGGFHDMLPPGAKFEKNVLVFGREKEISLAAVPLPK
jgi:hypothetical protein